MDEQERGVKKFDEKYKEEIEKLDGILDKNACNYIVDRLIEEIEKKYGTIVEKPIFVEKKIEILRPRYKDVDMKIGFVRRLWRTIF